MRNEYDRRRPSAALASASFRMSDTRGVGVAFELVGIAAGRS